VLFLKGNAMAIGTQAPLGYAVESTPGTAVAASNWLPIMDGSDGDTDLALQFPELITNTRDVVRSGLLGPKKTTGTLKTLLYPDMGAALLIGAVAGGGASSGTFSTTTTPSVPLASFTIELQKGNIQTFRLIGAQVDQLTVSAVAGKPVDVEYKLSALDYVKLASPGTPAYTTTDPLNFSDTAFTIGGTVDTDTTDFKFTLANNIVELHVLQAASAAPTRLTSGKVIVTGQFTKYFADTTLFDAYIARTYQALRMTSAAAGHSVSFFFPRVSIKKHGQPVKLGQFIVQVVDFEATSADPTVPASMQIAIA
jgi:Phage tail tube protein